MSFGGFFQQNFTCWGGQKRRQVTANDPAQLSPGALQAAELLSSLCVLRGGQGQHGGPMAFLWKMFDSVPVELSVPGKGVEAAGGVTAAAVLIPILRLVQHYIPYHRIVWLDIRNCCK